MEPGIGNPEPAMAAPEPVIEPKKKKSKMLVIVVMSICAILVLVGVGFILIKNLTEFKIDNKNRYEIITDRKWKTIKTDGGSYESTYYQVDLDNKTVTKKEEIFDSGFGNIKEGPGGVLYVQPNTEYNTMYVKSLNDELSARTKKILDNAIAREENNDCGTVLFSKILELDHPFNNDEYYNKSFCFRILTLGFEKDISDSDVVENMNVLLKEYDDL